MTVSLGDVRVCVPTVKCLVYNCLCLDSSAHYRSRFKEMGTHLHRQPRAGTPVCSSQVIHTSSYGLILQKIRLKPINQSRSPWPRGKLVRWLAVRPSNMFSCPLRIAQNSPVCRITMATLQSLYISVQFRDEAFWKFWEHSHSEGQSSMIIKTQIKGVILCSRV